MSAIALKEAVKPRRATRTEEPIYQLSVAQYHDMIQHGILTEDDPVELLDGYLVRKMPKRRPHSYATQVSRDVLAAALPAGWFVDAQEPITTEESEPEPDISVIRGERRQFRKRHPRPKDVGLLIEIADATLRRDRGLKKRIYAGALIAAYWIVNLPDQQVEVYTDPSGPSPKPDYGHRSDYGLGDEIPLVLGGKEVARIQVRELIP
jgi:Uma2 family endonuclease